PPCPCLSRPARPARTRARPPRSRGWGWWRPTAAGCPRESRPRRRALPAPLSAGSGSSVRPVLHVYIRSWWVVIEFAGLSVNKDLFGAADPEQAKKEGRRRLVLGDQAGPACLIGGPQLVDGVVIGICDVRAAARVDVFHDEVEQVAVRGWRQAEDAEVADVADVHRRRGDLGHRPRRAGDPQRQVQRLPGEEVPSAGRGIGGGVAVGRTGTGAAAG